ncbi:restriction endonuclease [Nocardia salmonicida]|uniref:restriction endonuclease n=1 Tax=Nocardia salmonicida TaxID=53431 RepID=UPI0007A45CE4|nr:restriction endonuclease [Nocardia salmonicida]
MYGEQFAGAYITSPQQAEHNAAVQMRAMGFSDATVTANGADGGIDVRSGTALAQVKWRGGAVSRPDVQQLFGARGSDFGKALLFFAASDYSQPAVEYADQHRIALFVYHPTGQVEPRNLYAASLLGSGGGWAGTFGAPVNPSNFSQHRAAMVQQRPAAPQGFFRRHWRLLGLVVFALGTTGGLIGTFDPDETRGETHAGNFGAFVLCAALTILFWYLYRNHRDRRTQ